MRNSHVYRESLIPQDLNVYNRFIKCALGLRGFLTLNNAYKAFASIGTLKVGIFVTTGSSTASDVINFKYLAAHFKEF